MNAARDRDPVDMGQRQPEPRPSAIRLLLIPLLVYVVWVLETYLLEGGVGLFRHYQPLNLILYTVFANIVIGTVVPVICLRSAFVSGAVNMFQIGFRSLRRTLLATAFTVLFGYLFLITFTPYGAYRLTLFSTLALILPVAISEVMICWVFVGTHVQAYVRTGGALVSITAGVLVTAALFGLSFVAHSPPLDQPAALLFFSGIGVIAAVFFFSVRDVYASALFVAYAMMIAMLQLGEPLSLTDTNPLIFGTAALSLALLIGCHVYLFRHFTTIRVPSQKR